jgi:hypothetical protein
VFGTSVPDSYCAESYRIGKNIYGEYKCFPVDQMGVIFGTSVSDHLCQGYGGGGYHRPYPHPRRYPPVHRRPRHAQPPRIVIYGN